MDSHLAPIHGISLERYADLGAAIADVVDDAAKTAEILEQEGVSPADFEAAKAGFTARMQDISLMGRVASAYMPLYQAALARRKGGRATASYEDFVAVSAAIKVYGYEVALDTCGVKSSDWTEVSAHWTRTMGANMMQYAGHHDAVGREEARLRAGGQPKKLTVSRVAGDVPSADAARANSAAAYAAGADPVAAAMQTPNYQASMQAAAQINANPFGFALGQVGAFFGGGVMAGSSVMVTHPADGLRYPGRVLQTAPQGTLVQFSNGSQQWMPPNAVVPA